MSPDCDSNGPSPVIRQLVMLVSSNAVNGTFTMLREGPYEEMGSLVSIDPSSCPPVHLILIFADKSLRALHSPVDSSSQLGSNFQPVIDNNPFISHVRCIKCNLY